jgi:hypothetical protein
MATATRILAKVVYAVTGAIVFAAGASVLLIDTGLLPDAVRGAVVGETRGNLDLLHILQEFGATLVFVGLIAFWFVWRYEQSQFFHWAMTAFLGLIALVHWFDVRGPSPSVSGPLVITVPFLVYVVVGLLRTATEGDRGREGGE